MPTLLKVSAIEAFSPPRTRSMEYTPDNALLDKDHSWNFLDAATRDHLDIMLEDDKVRGVCLCSDKADAGQR